MKLSLIKALYSDVLRSIYPKEEIELFFYIALQHFEKKSKTHVIVGEETFMVETYMTVLEELKSGKPIQYILESAPFYSLDLAVNESVLIPRPETEELVQWIIDDIGDKSVRICDIGTGSGCIALALAKHLHNASVSGCDFSKEVLELANLNAKNLELDVHFFQCDILQETMPSDFDILVSNPPYITNTDMETMDANVVNFEPHSALFVKDHDPLLFYRTIVAKRGLARTIYFEINQNQKDNLISYLESITCNFVFRDDLNGNPRMLRLDFES